MGDSVPKLRAPGESTSLADLKEPVVLTGYTEKGDPVMSFEWERKDDHKTDVMVLQCACMCRLRNESVRRFAIDGSGVEPSDCVLGLLSTFNREGLGRSRVYSRHVMIAAEKPGPGAVDVKVGDIVFEKGHSPLEARRVSWVGLIPKCDYFRGWLVEYERGMQSHWVHDGKEAPTLALHHIDSHTSMDEFHEHRHIKWQLAQRAASN